MILKHLTIENFRQFYRKQIIEFAQGEKNVTIFHGFNGSGKTTLLNVFVWCLYGETTPDFGSPDRLVSERAFSEVGVGKTIPISVTLRCVVRGEEWLISRSQILVKEDEKTATKGKLELRLSRFVNGEVQPEQGEQEQLQWMVNQILPKSLYPFFFFNGERVEWLAKTEASKDVERGIKTFLDVEIFERSMRHLRGEIDKVLTDELRTLGGQELREALDEEARVKQEIDRICREISVKQDAIAKILSEVASIENKQEQHGALQDLARQRDEKRKDLKRVDTAIQEVESDLAQALSSNGYLAFAEPVFSKTMQLIASARERGELPAKVKPQFVADLLDRQICICGRSLIPDKNIEEVTRLQKWKDDVGLAAIEEVVAQTSADVSSMRKRREECFERFNNLQIRRDGDYIEKQQLEKDLAVIEQKMGNRELGEDVLKLKSQLEKRRSEEVDYKADLKRLQIDLSLRNEELGKIQKKVHSLKAKGDRESLVKRQKEAVEHISEVLEEIYEFQKNDVRENLSSRVSEIWSDAAIKQYAASLSEEFTLILTKKLNGADHPVYGASTGERQVLALSFVGALVQKARENVAQQSGGGLGFQMGGEYPLIMDSAFGALEDDYRAKVASWIPRLANQVILMVSKTQWRNEVERETRPRIGKEYILELHTPKTGADRTIELLGKKYPYVTETHEPAELTLIQEVN